jgi:hypothetical protein
VKVPFQPEETCWPLGKAKARVQDVVAEPSLVIVIPAVKPPGQLLLTEYETWHVALAAAAAGPWPSATAPEPTSAVTPTTAARLLR